MEVGEWVDGFIDTCIDIYMLTLVRNRRNQPTSGSTLFCWFAITVAHTLGYLRID